MKFKHGKKLTLAIAVLAMAGFIWGFGLDKETSAKAPTPVDSKVQMVPMNFAELAKAVKPEPVKPSSETLEPAKPVSSTETAKTAKSDSIRIRRLIKRHAIRSVPAPAPCVFHQRCSAR